jgi:AcrR family transcriptional regulator
MSKRDDILNATLELINEEGLQSVTFQKIFKRANVGSGTLYNYFKNKDEIIGELFIQSINILESYELPENYESMELIEKFNTVINIFINFMKNYEKEYLFAENFSDYHIIKDRNMISTDEYYGVLKEFHSIIEMGQEKGIFRKMDVALSIQILSGIISTPYKGSIHGKYEFDDNCKNEIRLSCWKALQI